MKAHVADNANAPSRSVGRLQESATPARLAASGFSIRMSPLVLSAAVPAADDADAERRSPLHRVFRKTCSTVSQTDAPISPATAAARAEATSATDTLPKRAALTA